MTICTCLAVEDSSDFCSCGCDYCEEYCLPPEPEFLDDMDDETEYPE